MNPFILELCDYLESIRSEFDIGNGGTNLKVGELTRGVDGVFAVDVPSPAPSRYTGTEQHQVDFFSRTKSSVSGYTLLGIIYQEFHRREHYQTSNYEVYFSYVPSQIQDLDRDNAGSKILKLSVLFIVRNLNLIS